MPAVLLDRAGLYWAETRLELQGMAKRVVISIHGIRTRGEWQKKLVPMLARADFIPYAIDYGHFRAISLLRRSQRERAIDRLLRDYNDIVGESGDQRPSIIAHSFGTYQVAALIERYPNVRFDKVIFAASIVRSDFDWPRILAAGRVNYVENDFGGADVWPKVAARLISELNQRAIPARRAHEGRDCGAAEIQRIAENAPRWPGMKYVKSRGGNSAAFLNMAAEPLAMCYPGPG